MMKSISEQLKSIGEIMNIENVPDYTFTFGKYQGRSLKYVVERDGDYLDWVRDNVSNCSVTLLKYLQNRK